MKKIFVFAVLLIAITTGFYCAGINNKEPIVLVKENYTNNINELVKTVDTLLRAAAEKKDQQTLQKLFKDARNAYKKTEIFATYYNPNTAKAINGPALPEVEADNPEYPSPPSGFQVVEELLFPAYDPNQYNELLIQCKALQGAVNRLVMVNKQLTLTNEQFFDAVRLEIFRMEILGISGFDSPVAFTSIDEVAVTLNAMWNYIALYTRPGEDKNFEKLKMLFQQASEYATSHNDFYSFNRAEFITAYLNSITETLNSFQESLGINYVNDPRPLKSNAKTLFEKNIFYAAYYTSSHKDSSGNEIIALGRQLFNEKKLSVNRTRSCATCHIEDKAFTDGLKQNNSFDGNTVIKRNTPSILYASLQPALFADSRLSYLEDQAKQVIENPKEMHGNLKSAVIELSKDTTYKEAFYKAFNSKEINEEKIQKAIACYIRTKNSFSSRFDEYMNGDTLKMNQNEINGFNLFMGKAKCGTCHFMPLFSGNVPPDYLEMESEVLGVPEQKNKPYTLDKDSGKYVFIKSPPYLHAFKTPGLRNAAVTAPYMHNGVYETLEEVIDFYNKGGGTGLEFSVSNQTLPADELHLTKDEISQLISFINTLTDHEYTHLIKSNE